MADELTSSGDAATNILDGLTLRTRDLEQTATRFSRTMSQAFTSSITGGRDFDSVLKSLGLRLSDLALKMALKPLERGIAGGLQQLFSGLFGLSGQSVAAATGAVKPFAAGGVLGTPTYFPLSSGGLGLAGEAGPEAIMPLSRTADGRLGIAASGAAGPANVTIHIATSDADSFRRSESYITGQIARAVGRGQRGL
jgi:phage-related minor tail protein